MRWLDIRKNQEDRSDSTLGIFGDEQSAKLMCSINIIRAEFGSREFLTILKSEAIEKRMCHENVLLMVIAAANHFGELFIAGIKNFKKFDSGGKLGIRENGCSWHNLGRVDLGWADLGWAARFEKLGKLPKAILFC